MPNPSKKPSVSGTLQEKDILTDLLMSHKYLIDSYSKATVESADPKLRDLFHKLYTECLRDQDEIYNHMNSHGWYKPPEASVQEVQKAEQKFDQTVSELGIQG
ncbi:MAG: spore coat protein [Bacillota bacterium]